MSKPSNVVEGATSTALKILDNYSQEQVDLIKRTVCKGASDDELKLFMYQAHKAQLDPFARQIYSVARWDAQAGREVRTTQVGIDGFRLVAERTDKYEGQDGPWWCGDDGAWKDVWLSQEPPRAARVGVWKKGARAPTWGVALWSEYVQTFKKNGATVMAPMWSKMGCNQIAKCAEALALRKAFPMELSGLYLDVEMEQADSMTDEQKEQAIQTTGAVVPPSPTEEAEKRLELFAQITKVSGEKTAAKGVTVGQKGIFMLENWGCKTGDQLKAKTLAELQAILVKVQAAPVVEPKTEVVDNKVDKRVDSKVDNKKPDVEAKATKAADKKGSSGQSGMDFQV